MAVRIIEAGGALRVHVVRARMVDAVRDGAGYVGTGETRGLVAHGLGGTELYAQSYPETADEHQGCDHIPGAVRSGRSLPRTFDLAPGVPDCQFGPPAFPHETTQIGAREGSAVP
jgi:hypothetical protein